MTRGGRPKEQAAPERRCIITRQTLPKAELLRFVVGPEDRLYIDVAGKLPGRGLYVVPEKAHLTTALSKGAFARAAKQKVVIPDNFATEVEDALARHVVDLLSLARKSGAAIAGFEKVKEKVAAGSVALLLQASDGSAPQKAKIRPPDGENTLVSCLSSAELGMAFGRENVIHAALAAGGLCKRIVEEASKLDGLRAGMPQKG